jgi:hypothetical protein
MSITALDKAQWISVVKTTLYSGASAAFAVFVANHYQFNKTVLAAAAAAALAAAIKTVEKAFTPTV